jgi:hypothetical protein
MIRYELYDSLAKKVICLCETEDECHTLAKDLKEYEITLISISLREFKKIVTHHYKVF